ncbi:L-alanine-DL-glutamate epimerase-like enolase superfamily enzyme [Nitrospirillum amazonense]|uniref:L-alanine-DL-glutamate epimerase-like enolase superfamily enzyme n=1 Tax=Nitrospirillum amazonense TaxID=28077 RepID=A0A560JL84_9PROT|nr:mandelate racemase/muconate lactonizing enzyme family protein [Nitrospirillum amazonense]TWB71941.1 L-alanine-DL-glutamate epimerase-like enolase superfamily enzyme [Nitrospirillum amazonense]
MQIVDFRITRFQFARDRVIGDSQVRTDDVHVAALELVGSDGSTGLGFVQSLFFPLPEEAEIIRVFQSEVWPGVEGQQSGALAHRVTRPRGGIARRYTLPFEEALQQAVWDLFAKSVGLPLWRLLGARKQKVRAYASGLDFHLDDGAFQDLFAHAASEGFTAFKIKVGHPEIGRDIHRLDLLKQAVGPDATVMVDANEAWSPKQAILNLELMRKAGHEIFWLEDPIQRNDFDGLRLLRQTAGRTLINSGEYLDVSGKRALIEAGGADMLNVHGHVTDVMRIGWLAAEKVVPVTLGNSFLEVGVNMALALPEVEWLEYSYQNFDHLVEESYRLEDGYIYGREAPGHGLVLSEEARRIWRRPAILDRADLGAAPPQVRLARAG